MNIEKAKINFLDYLKKYEENEKIIFRKEHSLRVMENNRKIAESLNLTKEEIDVSTLIGMLHDIGKFEQIGLYNSYSDKKYGDHGDLGVEILEKDNLIRKFIETDKYDKLIKFAIKNHNKLEIEKNLDEYTLIFCKSIRDADKLDILYEAYNLFWKDIENEVGESYISDECLNGFLNCKIIHKEQIKTTLDRIIDVLSFIFDIEYKYSFKLVYENDYINKVLNRFNFKSEETKIQISKIREISNSFLLQKIN